MSSSSSSMSRSSSMSSSMEDPRYHNRSGSPSSTLSSAAFAMRKSSVAIVCSILLGIFLVFVVLLFYVCKYVPGVRARLEEAAAVAAAARAAGGLDDKLRDRLPVVSYQQLVSIKRGKENVECCPICLLDFDEDAINPPKKKRKRSGASGSSSNSSSSSDLVADGSGMEGIRLLPKCGHSFHSSCIDMWLFSHASCPVCRDCLAQR